MRLQESSVSGPIAAAKAVFPVQFSDQTLLFPSSCAGNRCGRERPLCTLTQKTCSSHCMCGRVANNSPYNRLLLPMTTRNEQPCPPTAPNNRLHDSWLLSSAHSRSNNYDSLLLNGFPSSYGKFTGDSYPTLDYALLASARRKNATRETTSTLKTWLNEHRKNPYPTKGEKVMLAILTKMTLTQVSTWFANARRRLKKENKMTWSPRKKANDKKSSQSCSSDSDVEGMDVDIENEGGVPNSDGRSTNKADSGFANSSTSTNFVPDIEAQRTSVIRTLESPTFDEIKSRFQVEHSPMNHLQKWVDGCFQEESAETPDYIKMTPPSTPIDNKVTTFTSQKLFEAFDAAKVNKDDAPYSPKEPSYQPEPLGLIFSSKQPVCSTKESAAEGEPPYMTPQPSPTDAAFSNVDRTDGKDSSEERKPSEYRAQGLTTSRELEAVLALTALCKT